MSQEYFPGGGSSAGEGSSRSAGPDSSDSHPSNDVPEYIVVGSGSMPQHATSLMSSLNQDSGYGGSIQDDNDAYHASLLEDHPTPPLRTPTIPWQTDPAAEHGKQVYASHVHQLQYNSNRTKLSRSIEGAIKLLKGLQEMNREWPAHYPSVQGSQTSPQRASPSRARSYGYDGPSDQRPEALRRAATTAAASQSAESNESAVVRTPQEPRLVTPQIAQEFSILKLDLNLGGLSQAELVHSLEKNSIASLLDGRVSQSIRHLLSLRDRIEDTSSKVLITGDLNAGKSTFCNALLRRKILPEDQQPCTSIFCEVLDARENGGIEEVHAIHKDCHYDRNDESTYDVYSLPELESLVVDNSKYMQCKVYVKDIRTIDESLLNNGVVDISLIDAPGLNSDSVKTTAVFARQEEIDVVVFVVSAANHFTLSARNFITNAAAEKAYMFMVVNGFDNIRDQERCQRMILRQIQEMSPQTFKESAELVHFVSSNAIPVAPADSGSTSGTDGGGGGGGGDWPDGDDDDSSKGKRRASDSDDEKKKDKGKGKEKQKIEDFENLESSLRRFVLERRSQSKLAPARTYLLNVLSDMHALASVNRDVASSELDRAGKELDELVPAYEESKRLRTEVTENVANTIEESCEDVYNHTRSTLSKTISGLADATLGVEYPGIFSAFQYAEDLKLAMLDRISTTVSTCENYARAKSVKGVNIIQSVGLLHVGADKFPNLNFRADIMFKQQRHVLARQVDAEIELLDFFDIASLWERQEKVAGTGMAMTVIGVLGGRAFGGIGWVDGVFGAAKILGANNLRRMLVPGIIVTAILTASYLVSQIPNSLPANVSRKLAASLEELDYTHSNASRISSEVRRVLRMPASRLQSALQAAAEDLAKRKDEVGKVRHESQVAQEYFAKLFRESAESRRSVEDLNLDAPLPGGMAEYQF